MLLALLLITFPIGFAWRLAWTIKAGRLPRLTLLQGVSREATPVPFWLYVGCLTVAVLGSATLVATILLNAAQRPS